MKLLKVLSTVTFIIAIAACITQIDTMSMQDTNDETTVEKTLPDSYEQDEQDFDDCGYQAIVVENPDKSKTVIIVPFECSDKPIDTVCDPALKDPIENYEVDSVEKTN